MLKEDILQLLKAGKDTYLSGQRISAQLGVSRAAVWKAVEALRKDGYGIDSRSNCGYRLVRVPDVMTQEALSDIGTRQVGRKVLYYDRLDSTNNEIKRLSIDQVENGLAVIADCQTRRTGTPGTLLPVPRRKGSVSLRSDAAPLLRGGAKYANGLVGCGAVPCGGAGLRRPAPASSGPTIWSCRAESSAVC